MAGVPASSPHAGLKAGPPEGSPVTTPVSGLGINDPLLVVAVAGRTGRFKPEPAGPLGPPPVGDVGGDGAHRQPALARDRACARSALAPDASYNRPRR